MGLDMYLTKRTYVKNWDHDQGELRWEVTARRKDGKVRVKSGRVSEIIEDVAYWRKANHIHQWFVDNCQEGIDDCREHHVTGEQLKLLLKIVREAILSCETKEGKVKVGDRAKALLPTQEGFFFGTTDYDTWYVQGLLDTEKVLSDLMGEPEWLSSDYYYRASW